MVKPVVDPSQPIDYNSSKTPSSYSCGRCKKTGVKLWRKYQAYPHATDALACADCTAKDQKVDITDMDERGYYTGKLGRRTVQIGRLIPAIPTEENNTFWGYGCSPPNGEKWWQRLPIR